MPYLNNFKQILLSQIYFLVFFSIFQCDWCACSNLMGYFLYFIYFLVPCRHYTDWLHVLLVSYSFWGNSMSFVIFVLHYVTSIVSNYFVYDYYNNKGSLVLYPKMISFSNLLECTIVDWNTQYIFQKSHMDAGTRGMSMARPTPWWQTSNECQY